MGAWGTGLYQDDDASDFKESFMDKVKYGKEDGTAYSTKELIKELEEEYEEHLEDPEVKYVIKLVLADLLWREGRLPDKIKKEAIKIIDKGYDLEIWKEESEETEYNKRKKVLEKLKEKLESKQPEERKRKIRKRPKPYICPWKVGDRYLYTLESEKAREMGMLGKKLIISIVEINDKDGILYRVQIADDNIKEFNEENIEESEYIIRKNDANIRYVYSVFTSEKITKKVQEKYKYIGNFKIVPRLEDEFFTTDWSFYDLIVKKRGYSLEESALTLLKNRGTNKHKEDLGEIEVDSSEYMSTRLEIFKNKYKDILVGYEDNPKLMRLIKIYLCILEDRTIVISLVPGIDIINFTENIDEEIKKMEEIEKEYLGNEKAIEILEKMKEKFKDYKEERLMRNF